MSTRNLYFVIMKRIYGREISYLKVVKNKKLWILGILTASWMLLIYVLSTQNGEQTAKLSLAISEILSRILGESIADATGQMHMEIRKLAPIVLFLILGVIAYLLMFYGGLVNQGKHKRSVSVLLSFLVLSGYGYFDEWHKQFIKGRHFQLEEVGLNIVSGCTGILAICMIQLLWNWIRRKET